MNCIRCVTDMSVRLALDAVCYRNYIPSELVAIIGKYFHQELDNKTIRRSVSMWLDNNGARDKCLLIFGHISYWDTSKVTNMRSLFEDEDRFNDDISNWDTSNVTDMSQMFYDASRFNQPLEKWNVGNVTNMCAMFGYANKFNQPLEKWDVSKVTDMDLMFDHAHDFNQPLNKWNIRSETSTTGMLSGAWSFKQPPEKLEKMNDIRETNTGYMGWNFANQDNLSGNANSTHILEQQFDAIDWSNLHQSPEPAIILEKNHLKKIRIDWTWLNRTFEPFSLPLNYAEMREKNREFAEELVAKTLNPDRIKRLSAVYDVEFMDYVEIFEECDIY